MMDWLKAIESRMADMIINEDRIEERSGLYIEESVFKTPLDFIKAYTDKFNLFLQVDTLSPSYRIHRVLKGDDLFMLQTDDSKPDENIEI